MRALLEDRRSFVWAGTTNGLSRYDGQQFVTYLREDGLPNERVEDLWEGRDGRIWIATQTGAAVYNPSLDQITPLPLPPFAFHTDPPDVLLTDLQLFNRSVTPAADGLLNRAIWETEQLTLAHDENVISFEFAAPAAPAERVNYRYRLVGANDEWTETNRPFLTFAQLQPGRYALDIQARIAEGAWGDGVSLPIVVRPVWWQTVWFRAGVLLAIAGAAGALIWQRNRFLRETNRRLSAEVATRTQELSQSEARFRNLASATFEAIIVYADDQILDANAVAHEMFDYAKLVGQSMTALLAEGTLAVRQLEASGGATELVGLRRDGTRLTLEGRTQDSDRQDACVVALRDITERKLAEQQQQELAAIQERERIGRNLHDDLGQVMGYINTQAHTAREQLQAGDTESATKSINRLASIARDSHDNIRNFILDIRERWSDDPFRSADSWLDALHALVDVLRERYALAVTIEHAEAVKMMTLADEVTNQLLRIVQESLNNVQKHADHASTTVTLTPLPDAIEVVVCDTGQGFDTTIARAGHVGLIIMQERAQSVGGTLDVQSTVGKGTCITAILPRVAPLDDAAHLGDVQILLVDDNALYASGLRALLETRGAEVVGIAHNGQEAVTLAHELQPDLILMDVEMPEMDGLEAARLIYKENPLVRIVMLTVAADDERLLTALRNGATGYLLKSLQGTNFFTSLQAALRGETVLPPALAARMLAEVALEDDPEAQRAELLGKLTARQIEVLKRVAEGKSNKEIADELFVSVSTVKFHIRQILGRLELENRQEIRRVAMAKGVVE